VHICSSTTLRLQVHDTLLTVHISMRWSGMQVFRDNMGKADTPQIKELGLSAADRNKDKHNWTQVRAACCRPAPSAVMTTARPTKQQLLLV
jgi:hypothetical protein